ncbi:helix-turn-helix domain-containing protein [Comamonas flocculans]|uniref:XRE family transcriptional regulator n=1 Tax=Comamonas flocculans TaxID=2597701 RepID=A0A5B8S0N6_9BURK|nr:XRE family transcriptional regulator [Comamonas flocculans]QEA13927.1 XRE family transcriptional regulator [Comamonas flocculans]
MTDNQRFTSVWDAIEDTPQEAASLRARSHLMMNIAEAIRVQGLTQAQAAALFGVTQPRISDLARGKVALFSLDALMDMAAAAGMAPAITVTVPKVPAARRARKRAPAHA